MSEPARMAPARRRGLADEVADRVRDAILTGAYPPGARLREAELDVSRGPVREALLKLEREGLVRSAWHRGSVVTTLSTEDIAELDGLRGALEQLAVRQVIANGTDDDLAAIEREVDRMARAEDEHAMVGRDIAFHDAIHAAAHHSRLAGAWQAIRSQVHLFLLTRIGVSAEHYLTHIPDEHRELITALRARDADTALELFVAHRRHAFAVLTGDVPSRTRVTRS